MTQKAQIFHTQCLVTRHQEIAERALQQSPLNKEKVTLQVSLYRLQKLIERGDHSSAVPVSPDYQVIEVICVVSGGGHMSGAEAIGIHPLA